MAKCGIVAGERLSQSDNGVVPRAFIANISELSTEDNEAVTASFFDGKFDTGRDDFVTYLRH